MSVDRAILNNGPGLSEVDAAVRAVLADRRAPVLANSSKFREPEGDVFAGRLLSLSQAELLGPGLRTVKVAPGTVVTPLAKDYLKQRGIVIQFMAKSEVERARDLGEWGFAIESVSGLIEAFRKSLFSANEVWNEVGTTLEETIHWLSDGEGRRVLHLTDEAAVAVYRGCQVPSVRAALAYDVESAARAVRGLGANLLVVEPSGKSIALLRHVGLTFRRAGGPIPPEWLAKGGSR